MACDTSYCIAGLIPEPYSLTAQQLEIIFLTMPMVKNIPNYIFRRGMKDSG